MVLDYIGNESSFHFFFRLQLIIMKDFNYVFVLREMRDHFPCFLLLLHHLNVTKMADIYGN